MAFVFEATKEIFKFEEETGMENYDAHLTKEIDQMTTDPHVIIEIENDMKDVEKFFSDDPALQTFKVKYEVD